jgi:hypothetical protein
MNGYSSHTYSWINADGEIFWVKYHFISDQGIEFLTQAEADDLAGKDGGAAPPPRASASQIPRSESPKRSANDTISLVASVAQQMLPGIGCRFA